MEGYETLEELFRNLNLTDVETILDAAYHKEGAGRPPRNPLGVFKAYVAKLLLGVRSLRELERRLWSDERLRRICELEPNESAYGRSVLSRFPNRVGVERVQRILNQTRRRLIDLGVVKGETAAMDGSFIKAYSSLHLKTRLPTSDEDARVGMSSRGYGLGYTLHLTVDASSELPLTYTVTPANVKETRVAASILYRAKRILARRLRRMVADRGYSSDPLRKYARSIRVEPIIPYTNRQRKSLRGVLRLDEHYKSHGPTRLKRLYRKRSSIERVFSRLEELGIHKPKVRGIRHVTMHVQLCIITMLLNALATQNAGNPSKIRSLKYYAN
jgi:transposase/IS5 family transposase